LHRQISFREGRVWTEDDTRFVLDHIGESELQIAKNFDVILKERRELRRQLQEVAG
jgi:hypothetical protein